MEDHEPTVRSRELGEGLRRAMHNAGLAGKDVARLLDLSPSWVSRLISGKRNVTAVQASAFLAVCQAPSAERERLLALCDEQHTQGWFQQHGSRLPLQLVTLIDHENKAVTISSFDSTLVPGLLQTGDYTRALLTRGRARYRPRRSTTGWPPGWPARPCSAATTRPDSPSTCTSSCCGCRSVARR